MPERPITFFAPHLAWGGVARSLTNLLTELAPRYRRIDLVTTVVDGPVLAALPPSVRVVRVPMGLPVPGFSRVASFRVRSALGVLPRFAAYLRRERPRALVSFQSSVIAVLAARASFSGVPVVVRESSTPTAALAADGRLVAGAKLRLKRLAYARAAAVVANSQGAADDLARLMGLPRSRVEVVYNPAFTPGLATLAAAPVEHPWLLAGEVPVVIASGRLAAEKDYPTLLRAFARVREGRPVRLVLLGDGSQRAGLEAQARALGIEGDVSFPGRVDNPHAYVARSSVFALTSTYEGLPNALIEAQACGIPCVSTDCRSGPREILLEGRAGTLAPVGDDATLAAGIVRYLDDPALAATHVAEGAAHLGRFTAAASAARYAAIIDRVASPPGARA